MTKINKHFIGLVKNNINETLSKQDNFAWNMNDDEFRAFQLIKDQYNDVWKITIDEELNGKRLLKMIKRKEIDYGLYITKKYN